MSIFLTCRTVSKATANSVLSHRGWNILHEDNVDKCTNYLGQNCINVIQVSLTAEKKLTVQEKLVPFFCSAELCTLLTRTLRGSGATSTRPPSWDWLSSSRWSWLRPPSSWPPSGEAASPYSTRRNPLLNTMALVTNPLSVLFSDCLPYLPGSWLPVQYWFLPGRWLPALHWF
jgi:hypothetical protein